MSMASSMITVLETCFEPGVEVGGLSLSERFIATNVAGAMTLFDAHTGVKQRTLDLGPQLALAPAFSPDGKLLAVSTVGYELPKARVEWFAPEAPSKRVGVDVAARGEISWSSNGQLLYINENFGWWRIVDKNGTTVARRQFTGTQVFMTRAGLLLRRFKDGKQTISPLDTALRERATWAMPDGAAEVLDAVDEETVIIANRTPDVDLEAPVEVALFSNGEQRKILGTLPGANYSVARRADGALVVLAVSMRVDGKGGDGVYVVDTARERIEHHRAGQSALWPPIALSPDGRVVFAFAGTRDTGSCLVGLQLPAPRP
jgi:hypothetical protein